MLLPCVMQSVHMPPLVPHAAPVVPVTHVPFAQHPPLHIWFCEHDVVHVVPLHAYPAGQLVVMSQLVVQ
jgi:hypothetical protein